MCGSWAKGSCCSSAGFCGATEEFCGETCISGPCDYFTNSSGPSGDVYIDPSIWSSGGYPTINCIPPCTYILPPLTLGSTTTIHFPLYTTSLQVAWPTSKVTTHSNGHVSTSKGYASTTKTTILTIPPVTTDQISLWNIRIPEGTESSSIALTHSILPPPFVITHDSHDQNPGITSAIQTRTITPPPYPYSAGDEGTDSPDSPQGSADQPQGPDHELSSTIVVPMPGHSSTSNMVIPLPTDGSSSTFVFLPPGHSQSSTITLLPLSHPSSTIVLPVPGHISSSSTMVVPFPTDGKSSTLVFLPPGHKESSTIVFPPQSHSPSSTLLFPMPGHDSSSSTMVFPLPTGSSSKFVFLPPGQSTSSTIVFPPVSANTHPFEVKSSTIIFPLSGSSSTTMVFALPTSTSSTVIFIPLNHHTTSTIVFPPIGMVTSSPPHPLHISTTTKDPPGGHKTTPGVTHHSDPPKSKCRKGCGNKCPKFLGINLNPFCNHPCGLDCGGLGGSLGFRDPGLPDPPGPPPGDPNDSHHGHDDPDDESTKSGECTKSVVTDVFVSCTSMSGSSQKCTTTKTSLVQGCDITATTTTTGAACAISVNPAEDEGEDGDMGSVKSRPQSTSITTLKPKARPTVYETTVVTPTPTSTLPAGAQETVYYIGYFRLHPGPIGIYGGTSDDVTNWAVFNPPAGTDKYDPCKDKPVYIGPDVKRNPDFPIRVSWDSCTLNMPDKDHNAQILCGASPQFLFTCPPDEVDGKKAPGMDCNGHAYWPFRKCQMGDGSPPPPPPPKSYDYHLGWFEYRGKLDVWNMIIEPTGTDLDQCHTKAVHWQNQDKTPLPVKFGPFDSPDQKNCWYEQDDHNANGVLQCGGGHAVVCKPEGVDKPFDCGGKTGSWNWFAICTMGGTDGIGNGGLPRPTVTVTEQDTPPLPSGAPEVFVFHLGYFAYPKNLKVWNVMVVKMRDPPLDPCKQKAVHWDNVRTSVPEAPFRVGPFDAGNQKQCVIDQTDAKKDGSLLCAGNKQSVCASENNLGFTNCGDTGEWHYWSSCAM